jgi:chlorobactene glucosyltransferase
MLLLMLFVLAVWVKRYAVSLALPRMERLSDPSLSEPLSTPPLVSVLVAARNEERTIARCLDSLLAQRYPRFEVIVADDRSEDSTPELLRTRYPSVRTVRIDSLPGGCAGKSHALSVAAREARGDWLLFTDADTVHSPLSIQVPLSWAVRNGVGALSLLPAPACVGFWEKSVQPIVGIMLFMLFPLPRINRDRGRMAFANGQYLLVRRDAYALIGGHEAVRSFPLEDIAMAQNAKSRGVRLRLLPGRDVFRCRMYTSLGGLVAGWERIFYLIFSDAAWALPLLAACVLIFDILPYLAAPWWPRLALAQLAVMHLAAERGYRFIGADRRYVFAHPLGCAVAVRILLGAFWKMVTGRGVSWKGGRYHAQAFLFRRP